MSCPRCGSDHITEEYKLVVCTDCGFVLDDSRLQAEGPGLNAPPDEASTDQKPPKSDERRPAP
jgi:transcription initiation factor TFIIIB Brf1 subunit/transcription initiation factor TFIIB